MKEHNWIAYLLIGVLVYTVLMIPLFEYDAMVAIQINFSIVIGLLILILLVGKGK